MSLLKHYKSDSYKITCCHDECSFSVKSTKKEPCWGNVNVFDEIYDEEDYGWEHRCEGHFYHEESGYKIE